MTTEEIAKIMGPFEERPRYLRIRNLTDAILRESYVNSPPVHVDELIGDYGLSIFKSSLAQMTLSQDDNTSLKDVAGIISIAEKVIVVNKTDESNRQVFTVAHEFGHYLMHASKLAKNPEYSILMRRPIGEANKDPIEAEANYFAGCLLVPPRMLRQFDGYSQSDLATLFAVSKEVIGYRLEDERIRNK